MQHGRSVGAVGAAGGASSFRRAAAALAASKALAITNRAGAGKGAAAVGASAVSTPERRDALSRVGADVERRLEAAAAHRSVGR